MKNYLIGFSDGSKEFSTSCLYLVSWDTKSNRSHTSLLGTLSKLCEDTKFSKTDESVPVNETHGILLCASNMIKTIQGFKECGIPLHGCYIGVDALSQIVALMTPPTDSKPRLRRYYASVNTHLYEIAKQTNQQKENIVFWINQK